MNRLPNFDRIARLYRWFEYLSLGPLLERTRNHHLERLGECRDALVLGDGDGRFTARLLTRHARMRVHAIDLSGAMLELMRRRVEAGQIGRGRLRQTQADARELQTAEGADLVVTHFFLDCLTQAELEELVARLAPTLAPQALWLVSEFRVPGGVMRWPARLYIRALYLAFRVLTGLRVTRLPDWAAVLERAGFVRIAVRRSVGGLLTAELWRARR